jgi:hypothetical protein
MKIKLKNPDEIVEIFAVYWGWRDKTYFYGMPEGYGGLLAYDASAVEVIDSELSGSFTYYSNNMKGIYHSALIEEKLLDDLLELDARAYKRFLEILGRG